MICFLFSKDNFGLLLKMDLRRMKMSSIKDLLPGLRSWVIHQVSTHARYAKDRLLKIGNGSHSFVNLISLVAYQCTQTKIQAHCVGLSATLFLLITFHGSSFRFFVFFFFFIIYNTFSWNALLSILCVGIIFSFFKVWLKCYFFRDAFLISLLEVSSLCFSFSQPLMCFLHSIY